MCEEPAGKPWSCDGEGNSKIKAGTAPIWCGYEMNRRDEGMSRIVRNVKTRAEGFGII